jgi:hypothetical protein
MLRGTKRTAGCGSPLPATCRDGGAHEGRSLLEHEAARGMTHAARDMLDFGSMSSALRPAARTPHSSRGSRLWAGLPHASQRSGAGRFFGDSHPEPVWRGRRATHWKSAPCPGAAHGGARYAVVESLASEYLLKRRWDGHGSATGIIKRWHCAYKPIAGAGRPRRGLLERAVIWGGDFGARRSPTTVARRRRLSGGRDHNPRFDGWLAAASKAAGDRRTDEIDSGVGTCARQRYSQRSGPA